MMMIMMMMMMMMMMMVMIGHNDDDAYHLCLLSYFFTGNITKWLVSYVVCYDAYNTGQKYSVM